MIGTAVVTDARGPAGPSSVALDKAAALPTTGTPVLVLHGLVPMRAALGIVSDVLLVRPLTPLAPSTQLHRREIASIDVEDGHWYALGRAIICIRRVKGPTLRMMAMPVPGIPDGTESLGRLLRAWWQAGQ